MPSIHTTLQQAFQTVMAIANHSLGSELAAVVLHNLDLFLLRMGQEFPLGLLHIVLGSKFGVFGRLLPEKGTAAKVCLQGYSASHI